MKKISVWSLLMLMTVSASVFGGQAAKGADTDIAVISAGTIDELKEIAEKEVEDSVVSMNEALEQLETDLDTYEKYIENSEEMETFYNSVDEETVCLLSNRKRKPDSYVKLSLNMEDYYRIMDAEKVGK